MRRSFSFRGFVIGQREWGEQDKILTLLTEKRGKLVVFAKGVRRIKSRRGGVLETGNLIQGKIEENKEWLFLGEVELIFQPRQVRRSLVLSGGLLFACQLVESLLPEREKNEAVYSLFCRVVEKLEKEKRVEILVNFEVELLELLGYGVPTGVKKALLEGKLSRAQKRLKSYLRIILEKRIDDLGVFLD